MTQSLEAFNTRHEQTMRGLERLGKWLKAVRQGAQAGDKLDQGALDHFSWATQDYAAKRWPNETDRRTG